MTLFSVLNTSSITIASDQCIVPASEVDSLRSALQAARRLSKLSEQMQKRVTEATQKGFESGYQKGFAKGEASAAEFLREQLRNIEKNKKKERDVWRLRAIDNALGIVRRIASSLGDEQTLAALAINAARELLPSPLVVVQVHPSHVDEVRLRMAAHLQSCDDGMSLLNTTSDEISTESSVTLMVEAEESLDISQCRLRSASGEVVLVGLDTQLNRIERCLSNASDVEPPESTL